MRNGLLDRMARAEARLEDMIKTVQAVARVVGNDEVVAELAAGARQEMTEAVTQGLREGRLQPGDVVAKTSLIVGQEALKDGRVLHPGRFQVFTNELTAEHQALFSGKKVGEKIDLPNGSVVTVQEIYDPSDPTVKKSAAAKKRRRAKPEPVEPNGNSPRN